MIRIEPHAFYSKDDLDAMFAKVGVDWYQLCRRVMPKKITKNVWYGEHLIEAFSSAPVMGESPKRDLMHGDMQGDGAGDFSKAETRISKKLGYQFKVGKVKR